MLEVRNVSKRFKSAGPHGVTTVVALQDVSYDVRDNEFVCIVGPSGCGKTTLLRIVAGLIRPTAGQVLVNGNAVSSPGPDRCMVFQHFGLFPWRDVLGNVEFGLELQSVSKKERREICKKYVEMVGLQGFEHHFPHQLSGGMQQRVGLARALSMDPDMLLMDEPFSAVDAHTRELLQEELLRIWDKARKTVLFVTHSIDEALYLADRVVVMRAKPGCVKESLPVDLPRPRFEYDVKAHPTYIALRKHIWDSLRNKL